MTTRGRKSAAALSVVAGRIDRRPDAPEHLTEEQRALWERIVASEPARFFKSGATQLLLEHYCRHVSTGDFLSRWVDQLMAGEVEEAEAPLPLGRLLLARDREVRAATSLATKLRLTNQARLDKNSAAAAGRNAGPDRKPWDPAS